MKQLLDNVLSVLFLQPDRYRRPARAALAAGASVAVTGATALLAFGGPGLWAVGLAYLAAITALPCKLLASDAAPDEEQLGPVLSRALFASMVAPWPAGLAAAARLPAMLVVAFAVHAAVQIWLQLVLPTAPTAAGRQFTRAGPAIGRFGGCEIAAWLVDVHGTVYEFVGCTAEPPQERLPAGQALVWPGIIYEARRRP